MKLFVALGAGCSLLAWCALAQVTVEVEFESEQFLANESLRAAVRITNFSGQTLKLGETPDWLDLSVESNDGFVVGRTADPPVVEAFEVPSAARATRWVDLIPYFNIGRAGRYRVSATVRIPALGLELNSKPAAINITSGAKIWEQAVGVPSSAPDASGAMEVRRYALVQSMTQKKVTLYVRVSDDHETRVFRVFPIGPVLAFVHPEAQVDRTGQLHVLFQTSAKRFTYVIVSPQGELIGRQVHQHTDSRPRLIAKDDGAMLVYGGYRLVSSEDIPKPDLAAEPVFEKLAPVSAPATNAAPAKPAAKKSKKATP